MLSAALVLSRVPLPLAHVRGAEIVVEHEIRHELLAAVPRNVPADLHRPAVVRRLRARRLRRFRPSTDTTLADAVLALDPTHVVALKPALHPRLCKQLYRLETVLCGCDPGRVDVLAGQVE